MKHCWKTIPPSETSRFGTRGRTSLRTCSACLDESRNEKYTDVVNLQRFARVLVYPQLLVVQKSKVVSTKILSQFFFTHKIVRNRERKHETERNSELIHYVSQGKATRPVCILPPGLFRSNKISNSTPHLYCARFSMVLQNSSGSKSGLILSRHRLKNSPTQNIFLLGLAR